MGGEKRSSRKASTHRSVRKKASPKLTGRIVLPGNAPYHGRRGCFNSFPKVIVYAQKKQDIVNAVRWARHHHVPVRYRRPGHSYDKRVPNDKGAMVIDISEMYRREMVNKGSRRILTQPIGPSPDRLIGQKRRILEGGLTDVPGILVGHAEDESGRTGCTVILCPSGAVPGVDVRGGFPGTIQTDAIRPGTATDVVQGVLLTGGSNFGLAAASGVMNWLAQNGIGAPTEAGPLPTVPGAVIFDLIYAKGARRPDAEMGYIASEEANSGPVEEGSVGAGAGATVGKIYGTPMKGGVGTASWKIPGGPVVAALAVVNAVGDIWDQDHIIAGALRPNGTFVNQTRAILEGIPPGTSGSRNTTIAVVATTGRLTKAEAGRVATLAHDGMARAISPVHIQSDGDTVFCLATGTDTSGLTGDSAVTAIGTTAAVVLEEAIIRGVKAANSIRPRHGGK
ncbi:FAD-binding protein [Brevibacillus sp. HB1.3]|uniref:P1 family peptidase n=1 Tax=Brevibacillus sp. HB1.3 TaxID=2738842 RepID=UPI001557C235|nr:P1 family peptidase [Brevibacillus sp. HB1.3]NQF15823.1 FAD-binding protein [Brevibacillus sp. HB1.3]